MMSILLISSWNWSQASRRSNVALSSVNRTITQQARTRVRAFLLFKIMKTIAEVRARSADIKPGTRLKITDYSNSNGETYDLEVEVLGPAGYERMLRDDLEILRTADVASMLPTTPWVDVSAAKSGLITAKEAALAARDEQSKSTRVGPAYDMLGDALAELPDKEGCLYILRLKCLSSPPPVKPAKGVLPRTKQIMTEVLNLPTACYIHAIQLAPGKFKSVAIL